MKATTFIRPPHFGQRFAVLYEASESGQAIGSKKEDTYRIPANSEHVPHLLKPPSLSKEWAGFGGKVRRPT